jgi:putative oxidoreductase
MNAYAPQLRSVLRIVAAFLFIQAGTTKIFGWPMAMPGGAHLVWWSEVGAAAILEVVGGGLLLLGLFTRPVAFILSGEMAVAYFQFHQPNGTWPIVNQGQPAVLFCFLFLYLAAAGGGPWSLDRVLRRVN